MPTTKHAALSTQPITPSLGSAGRHLKAVDNAVWGGNADDIIQLCPIGRGLTLTADAYLQSGDGDTGNAIVVSVVATDGVTVKHLIHQTTVVQGGGLQRPSKAPAVEDAVGFTIPAKGWRLELRVNTPAGAAQANTIMVGYEVSAHREAGAITE